MKNYDAYIFDFDYTLADATDPVVGSFLYALEKMNLQKSSRQDIINTIGIPIGESYTILTGDDSEEGIDLFKKYQKEKNRRYGLRKNVGKSSDAVSRTETNFSSGHGG